MSPGAEAYFESASVAGVCVNTFLVDLQLLSAPCQFLKSFIMLQIFMQQGREV